MPWSGVSSPIPTETTALLSLPGGEVTKPRFAQFFHGSLASLTIRPGKMESQKVISCLQACKEGLDINSLESLGQGIKVRKEPASPPIRFMSRRLPRASVLWEMESFPVQWHRATSGKGAATAGRLVTVTRNRHYCHLLKFLEKAPVGG